MKTENVVLMRQARESLTGKWGLAIGGSLVYLILVGAVNSIHNIGPIVSIIISGPMALGLSLFTLSISRGKTAEIYQIFQGFNKFILTLKTYLLMILYVILWSLLLIIPGIIAAISYSQIFFILADGDATSATEALEKSKKMMDGYKWKFVLLELRFVGWFILSVLTLGIGFLWFFPYLQVSLAKFYDDVSGKMLNNKAI